MLHGVSPHMHGSLGESPPMHGRAPISSIRAHGNHTVTYESYNTLRAFARPSLRGSRVRDKGGTGSAGFTQKGKR